MSKAKSELLATTSLVRPSMIIHVGQGKGGVGKTFAASNVVDLLDVLGVSARIVQIDDQQRLQSLYPGRMTTIPFASLDDVRRDPAAIVAVFDPLYAAIEATMADGVPLVVDVGGPQQAALEDYYALTDIDADLAGAGVDCRWIAPTTAEPEAMRGAVRAVNAIGRVLPSAQRTILLNHRDGDFRFFPGSNGDKLYHEEVEPLCRELGVIRLPAILPGSWLPFEAAGRRLIDVVAAEIPVIQSWTGRSRPAAKILRGDVASYLAAADAAFAPLLAAFRTGGER